MFKVQSFSYDFMLLTLHYFQFFIFVKYSVYVVKIKNPPTITVDGLLLKRLFYLPTFHYHIFFVKPQ